MSKQKKTSTRGDCKSLVLDHVLGDTYNGSFRYWNSGWTVTVSKDIYIYGLCREFPTVKATMPPAMLFELIEKSHDLRIMKR